MARESAVLENLRCSICTEFFTEPVTLSCEGQHTFCRSCIQASLNAGHGCCPECRTPIKKRTFKVNRILSNMVEELEGGTRPQEQVCGSSRDRIKGQIRAQFKELVEELKKTEQEELRKVEQMKELVCMQENLTEMEKVLARAKERESSLQSALDCKDLSGVLLDWQKTSPLKGEHQGLSPSASFPRLSLRQNRLEVRQTKSLGDCVKWAGLRRSTARNFTLGKKTPSPPTLFSGSDLFKFLRSPKPSLRCVLRLTVRSDRDSPPWGHSGFSVLLRWGSSRFFGGLYKDLNQIQNAADRLVL
uniref:RING-type domain-containing protein n=1 Tax=Denticeps clupeoides TaxID=299321 RepID=A0AAY4C3T0_9TELE